jgi:predicted dehydrogenase
MAPQDWTLNVGIVGLGKMGIMHACLLNTLPNVHVTALCDKSRLMRALAKRVLPKAAVTDSLEKFAGLGLDAIYVLTPIPIHYPLIKEICDCHLADHVFVEKTLSGSYKQSQELTKLAQDHLDGNMVGYMKRFAVTFNQAKRLLDKHAIGDFLLVPMRSLLTSPMSPKGQR